MSSKKVLVVAFLIGVAMTAFSNGQGEEASGDTGATVLTTIIPFSPVGASADFEDIYAINFIENKFDVDFQITTFDRSIANERMNIVFASGDLPDILMAAQTIEPIKNQAIQTGQFLRLDDYYAESEHWPTNPFWDDIQRVIRHPDGHIYTISGGVYGRNALNAGGRYFYNKTLAEELGFGEPETLDDIYEMLVAVRENDPDSMVMSGLYETRRVTGYFLNAFGMKGEWDGNLRSHINMIGGEAVLSYEHENYLPYLEFMHRLYNEGLIDPEFFTQQQPQLVAKAEQGRLFFVSEATQVNLFGENETVFDWYIVPPVRSDYNSEPWWPEGTGARPNRGAIPTSSTAPDKAWEILDWFGSREANQIMYAKVTEETFDPESLPEGLTRENIVVDVNDRGEHLNPPDMLGMSRWPYINQYQTWWASSAPLVRGSVDGLGWPVHEAVASPDDGLEIGEWYNYNLGETLPPFYVPYPVGGMFSFTDDQTDVLERYEQELQEYIDEMQAKFIVGVRPLSEFDQFQQELKEFGIDEVTEVYTQAARVAGF